MRYILILLITVGFAFAQTQREIRECLDTYPNSYSELYSSIPDNWYISILKYAEECYNDSIHIGFLYVINDPFAVQYTLSFSMYAPLNYLRKESVYEQITPTFEGFIEWLKQ